jgi:signal transduction histidine kinase
MMFQDTSKGQDLQIRRLLAYVVDLEVEVDRLRQHNRLVNEQIRTALEAMRRSNGDTPQSTQAEAIEAIIDLLRDLQDLPGYHPAHDQVVAVAVRPLAENVFRYHQRLTGVRNVTFEVKLESDHLEWFAGRLRHILDNLISNALKYRDAEKSDTRIVCEVRTSDPQWYRVSLSDNGLGMKAGELERVTDLYARARPVRESSIGVGLAIVKRLVEQSGGAMSIDSREGEGTTINVILPRFALDDYLT